MSGDPEPKWGIGAVAAVAFGIAMVVPLYLPIPGLEVVPVLAQAAAVGAVFLVLPVELAGDAGRPRRGSAVRLLVLGMVATAALAWGAGAIQYGFSFGSLLSLVNWIALGALVVCGQVLFATERRLAFLLTGWATAYAVASAVVVIYLAWRFGGELFVSANRVPFQTAGRIIFPTWPNYFGVALAVGICIFYGRVLAGRAALGSWIGLLVVLSCILISFSRTAWIAGAAAVVVMTAASTRSRRALVVMTVGLLFTLLVASRLPAVQYQFVATLRAGSSQQLSILERLVFAAEAVRLWRENPLFGIGFHRFDEFANVWQVVASSGRPDVTVGSVHNEYLSTLLKGGLLVAAGFLIFLGAAARMLRRVSLDVYQTSAARHLAVTGLGITAVLLVAGVAMESFRTISVSGPFWLLVGALSMLQGPATGPKTSTVASDTQTHVSE